MFTRLCHADHLHAAWKRVRANGAAPGGDGENAAMFSRNLENRLAGISASLRHGSYRPGPLLRVRLQRPDGKSRLLRIPGLADRVVQTACQKLLSERLDARMSRDSYAYRPARSVDQALRRLRALAPGNAWLLDADIAAFFDRVPHARLLDELGIWIDDERVLRLVALWLKSFAGGRGLAQGAPISPVLANLFLHPLDRAFACRRMPFVRYADDFVVLAPTRGAALAARDVAGSVLARRGLALNEQKTGITRLDAGFRFLGQDLRFISKR